MAETSQDLDQQASPQIQPPGRVDRPWGWFESLGGGEGYQVKRLLVRAGNRISLQRHQHRSEQWVVVSGDGWLDCEGSATPAELGTCLAIPQGAVHRATAGSQDLLIVEVQHGRWLSEDDIERLSDDYGRVIFPAPAPAR